jgi:subtilase family serine protease
VTSVGGTDLTRVSPRRTEQVWNEAADESGAGGGGISSLWPMPAYQAGPGVVSKLSSGKPCGLRSGYCRETPDVAASADPVHGYEIYYHRAWGPTGGTSAAAPLWAALTALIDVDQASLHPVGFLNPALYSLEAARAAVLNDVTVGNDDYTTTNNGLYPATAGYDMASGLGTPVGSSLASALATAPVPTVTGLSPSTGPARGGTSVTITGTGLAWTSAVDFGKRPARDFKVVSPTTIVATSPNGTGVVDVTVTTPAGKSAVATATQYTYG